MAGFTVSVEVKTSGIYRGFIRTSLHSKDTPISTGISTPKDTPESILAMLYQLSVSEFEERRH